MGCPPPPLPLLLILLLLLLLSRLHRWRRTACERTACERGGCPPPGLGYSVQGLGFRLRARLCRCGSKGLQGYLAHKKIPTP